jgi:hypothetical protein
MVTRVGFDRVSKLQQRMRHERTALDLDFSRDLGGRSGRPSILLAGNSLLLEGVDFDELRHALSSRGRAYRYIVTQTVYFDWYYGLRRLFAEGVRPTYLLFGMSSSHLVRSSIRGDYSAYYLFDLPGLLEYSYRQHTDLTTASSLVFAHFSKLYSVRSEIRATLVEKLLPSYADALHTISSRANEPALGQPLESAAAQRLRELDQLCRSNGVRLIFILPPTDSISEHPILAAGRRAGVSVLLPLSRSALADDQFSDGFHLNQRGRAVFTRALIANLLPLLPDKSGDYLVERQANAASDSEEPRSVTRP